MSADTENAAYLGNIPSMVAFLPGLASEERTDIQNVLLDAQLFAGRQFDFKTQWGSWMHYYRSRLKTRGIQQKGLVLGDSLVVSSVDDLLEATFKVSHPRIASVLATWCSVRLLQWGSIRQRSRTFKTAWIRGVWAVFRSYPAKSMSLAGCSSCFAVCT